MGVIIQRGGEEGVEVAAVPGAGERVGQSETAEGFEATMQGEPGGEPVGGEGEAAAERGRGAAGAHEKAVGEVIIADFSAERAAGGGACFVGAQEAEIGEMVASGEEGETGGDEVGARTGEGVEHRAIGEG